MEEKLENLLKEMSTIGVDGNTVKALNELTYTASETGILPFSFHDDNDLITIIKLVELAKKYGNIVPDSLRM